MSKTVPSISQTTKNKNNSRKETVVIVEGG